MLAHGDRRGRTFYKSAESAVHRPISGGRSGCPPQKLVGLIILSSSILGYVSVPVKSLIIIAPDWSKK